MDCQNSQAVKKSQGIFQAIFSTSFFPATDLVAIKKSRTLFACGRHKRSWRGYHLSEREKA
jgi:hypothetical protein